MPKTNSLTLLASRIRGTVFAGPADLRMPDELSKPQPTMLDLLRQVLDSEGATAVAQELERR